MTTEKIGRNDKCLCGSGKKYKKCCYLTREAAHAQGGKSLVNHQLNELKNKVKAKNSKLKEVESDVNMGSVISDFVEEMYDAAETVEEKKNIIRAGILFWNLTVLLSMSEEPEDQKKIMDRSFNKHPSDQGATEQTFYEMLNYYTKRKKAMFDNFQELIIDYTIDSDQKGEVYFSVVFSPADELTLDQWLDG